MTASTPKITFIGAESTGKTTLSLKIAAHLSATWIPEYGRVYVEQVRSVVDQRDMDLIVLGQMALEDWGRRHAQRLLVCDTDMLTSCIWNERYFNHYPDWMSREFEQRRSDLFLLCDIDLLWVADEIRDSGGERRRWFHRRFLEELHARHLPYALISGTYDERFQRARDAITQRFPEVAATARAEQ
jgi:NadR type nicotinamide-nucleotide adenylyltransferase